MTYFHGNTLPRFFAHERTAFPDLGYLLLEHVEDGAMLYSSWQAHRADPVRRRNLYTSLANILLDLSKAPLPRIGSWTMDNRGVITLSNRPFFDLTAFWARHKIPVEVQRVSFRSSRQSPPHIVTHML